MKLSELKGEKAIDAFADLLIPVSEIFSDKEIVEDIQKDLPKLVIVQKMLKNHVRSVIQILAILDGEDPETYEPTFATIPLKLLELMNDKALVDLFTSQGQNANENVSGSAMENIGEEEN